jgi:putative peptide zinc metalloprotease protein
VLHGIAFSAMLFGSVQTFLINANPLMRFDGYYAMSDYLEDSEPQAEVLRIHEVLPDEVVLGTTQSPPGHGGFGFVVYAVLASIYRVMLTIAMIWFFSRILEPYKLAFVGWGLSCHGADQHGGCASRSRNQYGNTKSVGGATAFLVAPAGGHVARLEEPLPRFSAVPIPHRAYAVLTMEPAQSAEVSTSTRGQIVKTVCHRWPASQPWRRHPGTRQSGPADAGGTNGTAMRQAARAVADCRSRARSGPEPRRRRWRSRTWIATRCSAGANQGPGPAGA